MIKGIVTKTRYGVEISESYEARALPDGRGALYVWDCDAKKWELDCILLDEQSAASVGEHVIRNRLDAR